MKNENHIFRSLEIIESRITEKLTVENIAAGVFISKYHYMRLFREIVGGSVMEYVTKRKLTLAGKALLETDASILEVALDCGFDSRDGFSRSFKAYMGVTPAEYRKYGLAAISQTTVKGRSDMTYSKTTDEILRELNNLIVIAKETAQQARKCDLPWYKEFWCNIADQTDIHVENLRIELDRVANIAEHPDEITNRFRVIKAIDDIAFIFNVISFHAGLTIARANPDGYQKMQPLCDKYLEIAAESAMKSRKIAQFFIELSALIFEDMRKTATEKAVLAAQSARVAADMIKGYSYIKSEIANIADALVDAPISIKMLDDFLFRLQIISFAVNTDVLRSGGKHKAMFDGIEALRNSLDDAVEFFKSLPTQEVEAPLIGTAKKALDDIAFQGNILFFFTRGEVSDEKLGAVLDSGQKAAFDAICGKINELIQFAYGAEDASALNLIADKCFEIRADLLAEAEKLDERGGPTKLLADTFGLLGDKALRCGDGCKFQDSTPTLR